MDLQGFDTTTMTYLATQMAQPKGGPSSDPFENMLLPTEMPNHHSDYAFAGSDEFNMHRLPPQATPSLKRFSSTYEDPFSDVVSAFDKPINQEPYDPDAHSIDRDNKLLSFSPPTFDYTLLDYTFRRTTVSLTAQLQGMFFLAESHWPSIGDAAAPPNELTCYRRNLFQISGEITLPRTLRYVMTDQGEHMPILGQELVISAVESTEGNAVKIISVPWKKSVNPNITAPEDKVEREPPSIPVDLTNAQISESDFASYPLQWKRLQFRIATANNGRRKELQQHFVVRLKLLATLATGDKIPICEVQSGAIVVRGRSPRNFQSRKDMPLNGAGHARKVSHLPAQLSRTSTGESGKKPANIEPIPHSIKAEPPAPPMSVQSFYDPNDLQINAEFYNLKATNADLHGAMTALPQEPVSFHAMNLYAASSPDLSRHSEPQPSATQPISLSLLEEETPEKSTTPPDRHSAKRIHIPPRPPSFSLNVISSPDESADLLYEYFPLGLDDWMPPVDAVYRPHVIHHIKLPSNPRDPKSSLKGARSKRYFSEDLGGT